MEKRNYSIIRGLEYYIVSVSELRTKYNEEDFDKVNKDFHSKGLEGLTDEELKKIGLSKKELEIVAKCIRYSIAEFL